MSWADIVYARGVNGLTRSTDRHVLLVVATHANRMGRAWPAMQTIAAEIGMSRATVLRALARIEAAAAVQVIHRPGSTSQFRFPHLCHPDPYLCHLEPNLCHRYATRSQERTIKEREAGANSAVENLPAAPGPPYGSTWTTYRRSDQDAVDACPYCDHDGWLHRGDAVGRCSHRVSWPETTTVDDMLDNEQLQLVAPSS